MLSSAFAGTIELASESEAVQEKVYTKIVELKLVCDAYEGSVRCGEYGHSSCPVSGFQCPVQDVKKVLSKIVGEKIISIEGQDLKTKKLLQTPLAEEEINFVKLSVTFFQE